jgi:hypothetical protein
MAETIELSLKEYEAMKEEIALLKDNELLKKMNRLIELLCEEKYGLYLGNNTADLTDDAISKHWSENDNVWDTA